MNETIKFLQAASNAVAGNVAGPVDLISAALNKLGIPVQQPVGGSDWMRQKGLMVDVPLGSASVLGETAGLLAPTMMAAKAPQIAKGLLQMGENMAAPRTLNPQTGAIVWHGSPHKFDKFDSSKIGTGEGAQAYGHGLYLAESDEVAKGYQQATSKDRFITSDGYFDPSQLEHLNVRAATRKGDLQSAIDVARKYAEPDPDYPEVAAKAARDLAILERLKASGGIKPNTGSLYKVDLPDDAIAKMLDWDKPLSQQPKAVQTAYKKYLKSPQASEHAKSWTRYSEGMRLDQAEPLLKNPGGENLYKNAFPSREAANQWALENGIPGIRYLDGGSRGAGSGTSNFVVFPGNEGLLTILERNGQALR